MQASQYIAMDVSYQERCKAEGGSANSQEKIVESCLLEAVGQGPWKGKPLKSLV